MKKQKENSHEDITWYEMGKQNVQAEKVYSRFARVNDRQVSPTTLRGEHPSALCADCELGLS